MIEWRQCLGLALFVSVADWASGQTTLNEHGVSTVAVQQTMSGGTAVTLAWGVVFSAPTTATATAGWLHHHEPASGNDCPNDLNQDGIVTTLDLLVLLADFGCVVDCTADPNGDGITSAADLLSLLAAYGDLCP